MASNGYDIEGKVFFNDRDVQVRVREGLLEVTEKRSGESNSTALSDSPGVNRRAAFIQVDLIKKRS